MEQGTKTSLAFTHVQGLLIVEYALVPKLAPHIAVEKAYIHHIVINYLFYATVPLCCVYAELIYFDIAYNMIQRNPGQLSQFRHLVMTNGPVVFFGYDRHLLRAAQFICPINPVHVTLIH